LPMRKHPKELEEIGDERIANLQAVHIDGENHLVVTQLLDAVLNVERT